MLGAATSLTHGSTGLALGYASVAAPMLLGMARNRASWRRLLAAPIYALPVTLAAGTAVAAASSLSASFGWSLGTGALSTGLGAATTVGIGYIAGRLLAKPTGPAAEHRRGTVVLEHGSPERIRTSRAWGTRTQCRAHIGRGSGA